MKRFEIIVSIWLAVCTSSCTQGQDTSSRKHVGGPCEGCEAIYEYGSKKLSWVDTLPDYHDKGPKLEITGTIYKEDGKTPASDVILYIYHTNQEGIYPEPRNAQGWEKRHGYIRGWIKTDRNGRYKFLTLRPGAYPGRQNPEHIHATIKEPDINEYWIDEYRFSDDPILKPSEKNASGAHGGSGILTCKMRKDGTLVANRDIILGLNIPNY